MILIFGGTTEGRIVVDTCEQAGKPYYYSTRSNQQSVEMVNGVRLIGAMTSADIVHFCRNNDVRCIIDASHPFAEGLHQSIADAAGQLSHVRIIRFERQPMPRRHGVCYCRDFDHAVQQLQNCPPRLLLALSGVNTMSRLHPYWQHHRTMFRILNRKDSREIALAQGFPATDILYYDEHCTLPTKAQECELMQRVGCDAIITKDSGEQGGFDSKVDAAIELGIKVFVVERPRYDNDIIVTGRHGLHREIERFVPGFFPLRTGLTTGTCATAAVKAALLRLLGKVDNITETAVELPDGEKVTVPIGPMGPICLIGPIGYATVIKDFSDDPDVTRGCCINAKVEFATDRSEGIRFLQGKGVGRVTLPGLGIPVGEPAINPTPRKMIELEVRALTDKPIDITISVEGGEELAERTFNSRVGVVGGISIIGTSGIVSPLSNDAFIESIGRELQVARAMGKTEVGLASGKQGEEALLDSEPELRVVHYGNFIGAALQKAHELGFSRVLVGIMLGKAVKLAEGHLDTHSHKVLMNKNFLSDVASSVGVVDAIAKLNNITMARELWNIMPPSFFERIRELCHQHCRTVFPSGTLEIRLIR
ncbi:MAG: cobalamin biosynthesis protein CbiD [Bacteroidaceae bacterium]|nr:cobalamin biosynthesis protein CbiD [Bacteroidaceae bacterium]